MWDVTNAPNEDIMFSLCPMGLRGQTNKCKTPKNSNFLRNDKIVISIKIRNFSEISDDEMGFIVGIVLRNLAIMSNSETVKISCF